MKLPLLNMGLKTASMTAAMALVMIAVLSFAVRNVPMAAPFIL